MSKLFTITEGLENMGAVKTGGQGSVYKGRRTGEIITAIKLLPTPVFPDETENKHYTDFLNEVAKLERVRERPNPNIVKILSHGVSETGGFPFIEMEYIDGPDLAELLKPPYPPVFTIREVIKVAEQLSNALGHCHSLDIRHGDIKSNNVKYNQHTGNYVLLDFGLAILSDEQRRTSLRRAGAIEFMAPEQNEGHLHFQTDVYSFGIILYELLAGVVPFPLNGASETARNKVMVAHMETAPPDLLPLRAGALPADWLDEQKQKEMRVPGWLTELIYKCLQKLPGDRFANGIDLHEFISHQRIHASDLFAAASNESLQVTTLLNEKEELLRLREDELEELKAIVQKQDKELRALRTASPVALADTNRRSTVSRSTFNVLLVALLLVAGLAVYGLFFSNSVVGSSQARNIYTTDTLLAEAGNASLETRSETANAIVPLTKREKKQQKKDSLAAVKKAAQEQRVVEKQQNNDTVATRRETPTEERVSEKPASTIDTENPKSVRYKVRNKAFFHDEPDAATRRGAFIVHWNKAVLKPLNEKDGFIYVVFTNHLGQTSKGWLAKSDLIEVE